MPEPLKIRRQTQVERRAESEQRLLAAAAEIIATEGFGAASLERIGAAAGYRTLRKGVKAILKGKPNAASSAVLAVTVTVPSLTGVI